MDIAAVESIITGAFLLLMLALIIAGLFSTFKAIALGESSRDLFAYFGIAGLLGAVMAVHRALPRLIESLAAEASPAHPVILIGIGVVVVVPVVGYGLYRLARHLRQRVKAARAEHARLVGLFTDAERRASALRAVQQRAADELWEFTLPGLYDEDSCRVTSWQGAATRVDLARAAVPTSRGSLLHSATAQQIEAFTETVATAERSWQDAIQRAESLRTAITEPAKDTQWPTYQPPKSPLAKRLKSRFAYGLR